MSSGEEESHDSRIEAVSGEPTASPKAAVEAEEMEDLFGDESDKELDKEDTGAQDDDDSRMVEGEDNEQEMYNRKFYGDATGESDEETPREFREADVDVVKHIVPYPTASANGEKGVFYAKIPELLTIDPIPFDPPAFQDRVEQRTAQLSSREDQMDDRLIDENTVRWRYSRDNEQNVFKESNSQIVQWSDGSYSLRLGDEYTDVLINDTANTYLAVSHDQQELIQSVRGGDITKTMIFIPTSTSSKNHQRLTKAVARKEKREHQGPNTYIQRVDPELEQKELERKQNQIMRERRKRQLREQQEREGLDSPEPTGMMAKSSRAVSASRDRDRRSQYDEYEDDGFMVDDEDENDDQEQDEDEDEEEEEEELDDENVSEDDEAKAERLRKLKQNGAAQYREDNDEDEATTLKRRKIAVLDEEDEDDE
ncbi:LAFA_0D14422g1_1 [Lachancea sp. 'fantastica']|nr:LAFA_0D14422g1_1 [Lachancea sp. 'fantastica']